MYFKKIDRRPRSLGMASYLRGAPTTTPVSIVSPVRSIISLQSYKKCFSTTVVFLDRLNSEARANQHAVLRQTPGQAWDHSNCSTDYRVWTERRLENRQLILFMLR